jgi:GT2 family glycosyltransferase
LQTFSDFETILVDNGSVDGSTEFIRTEYPWVTLVALPENIGFAAGNNRGLAASSGEFIVTLNNDITLEPGFLAALLAPVLADASIGMVAAKMLNYYASSRIDAIGLIIAVNGLGYNLGVAQEDRGQYDIATDVFGSCGGAALYRRKMLTEVGFFDEDFFAYYEDFDLAWRCRLAGWGSATAPRAVVYHVHSATSGEWSPFKVYQAHRNKWFVILKNWPVSLIVRHLPQLLTYDLAALLLAAVKGRSWAALSARLAVLRHLTRLWRQRAQFRSLRKLTDIEVQRLFAPHESAMHTLVRKFNKGRTVKTQ